MYFGKKFVFMFYMNEQNLTCRVDKLTSIIKDILLYQYVLFSWSVVLCVESVDKDSAAYGSGLRKGDILSHVNSTPVHGLLHVQVIALLLSGGDRAKIQVSSLANTTIRKCATPRRAGHAPGRMMRMGSAAPHPGTPHGTRRPRGSAERHRLSSLLRRLSSRKVEQLGSPSTLPPPGPLGRGALNLNRSLSSGDTLPDSSQLSSPPLAVQGRGTRDSGSSSGSSGPNSPGQLSRPSSLQGLRHRVSLGPTISPSARISSKHITCAAANRRKSWHNIPPSPLARTPVSSPLATSPTPIPCQQGGGASAGGPGPSGMPLLKPPSVLTHGGGDAHSLPSRHLKHHPDIQPHTAPAGSGSRGSESRGSGVMPRPRGSRALRRIEEVRHGPECPVSVSPAHHVCRVHCRGGAVRTLHRLRAPDQSRDQSQASVQGVSLSQSQASVQDVSRDGQSQTDVPSVSVDVPESSETSTDVSKSDLLINQSVRGIV